MDAETPDERPATARDEARAEGALERAHDVFARALRFLARCADDPRAAASADDTDALVRDLKALAAAPPPPAAADSPAPEVEEPEVERPQALPLRRRRSA